MKAKDIRELDVSEIEKKRRDTCDQLLHLKLHKETGQVESPSEIRNLRREIARLSTIAGEKRRAKKEE